MIKIIKRTTDNKFLKSFENDTWVSEIEEAFEMTYRECESIKNLLKETYTAEQLKEIVNLNKYKTITDDEKEELLNLLKNKK